MRIGKYTIKLSERGKHYGEIIGGLLCIAVMFISISVVAVWLLSGAWNNDNLKVTHIYEDNCIDIYDTETGEYYFYCEDKTFYGKN